MIICSREAAQSLIQSESNLFRDDERNKDIVSEFLNYETKEIKHGRGDSLNLDDEQRKEIATLALTSGLSIEEVSKLTGASPSQVSAYKNGATSTATYHDKDKVLGEHVESVKSEITSAAQNKLKLAIEALTGEKINSAKARDIAGIAKDMSQIVRNIEGDSGSGSGTNVKVMIYQPRAKEESDFKVIEVNE